MHDPAFAAPGRFWKGNVHTHSTLSDGAREPAAVCEAYRARGYDFLGLTDHFLARYGWAMADTRGQRGAGFTTLIGAELHAPATALGELWHILAVGLPLDFAPNAEGETGPALAQRALDAGAFVAIPHPAWYGLTRADAESIPGAHAIEAYNHTSEVRTQRGDGLVLADQLLAAGRDLTLIAVDDAHFHCEDAFGGWLMVKAEANEPEPLLAALKSGAFYATQGPEILDVEWSGTHVTIRCSPAAAVIVTGRGSRATQLLAADLTEARLPLEVLAPGGSARVTVVDAAGRRAWANPARLATATSP
jgi:hypothetical protein